MQPSDPTPGQELTSWTPISYQVLGGLNQDDAEDSVGPTEVVDSANFLYERGQTFTRPGVGDTGSPITGSITGLLDFAQSFRVGTTPVTVLVTSDGKIWSLSSALAATQITPAGSSAVFGDRTQHNATVYNSATTKNVLIGNAETSGLVDWNIAGTTYVLDSTAVFGAGIYVSSFLSRAIMGNDVAETSAVLVRWSAAGDQTNWSAPLGGSAPISDATDDITGVGVIRNVAVILRRGGIHFMLPTGVSLPTFRFETYIREGAEGCLYPSTAAWDSSMVTYVGTDDVYVFDLSQARGIGRKIRNELLGYLANGINYYGFFSYGSSNLLDRKLRRRYNLVPMNSSPNYPHFVYDFLEDKWSKHFYGFNVRGGFYFIPSTGVESTVIYDNSSPPNFYIWDSTQPCESSSFFLGQVMPIKDQSYDYTCQRVLMRTKNYGQAKIAVTVYATDNNTRVSKTDTKTIGALPIDESWMRNMWNFQVNGQDMQVRVDVPPNTQFSTNYCELKVSRSGIFKGDPVGYGAEPEGPGGDQG